MDAEGTATMNAIPRWKNRARWWGLPIIFEWYEIARDKLIIKRGLLMQQEELLPLYRIVDVKMERSLLDLIFSTGRIHLFSVDAAEPILTMRGKRSPENGGVYIGLRRTPKGVSRVRGQRDVRGIPAAMASDISFCQ